MQASQQDKVENIIPKVKLLTSQLQESLNVSILYIICFSRLTCSLRLPGKM